MSEKPPDEVLELARRQMAARREAEQIQQMQTQQTQTQRERPWRYIFLGIMGTLLLALLFTPGLPLQWKMYAVVHGVCAQQHNIFIGELQVPICARNSGIYISFLLTMIYFWVIGRGRAGRIPPWSISAVLIAFVVIMGIDGFNSLFLDLGLPYLYTPRNELRTLTGMGMGVGVATVMLLILNTTLRQNVDDQQPLLKNWRELGGVLLLDFLILVALYGNLELLYWPLAFLSFTGIISVLYLVSLLLVSLFMGYEGRVTHLAQLAKPATIALVPTLIMLAALSGLRFWLEAQGLII
jgi:uncharacterized membrane protein